MTVIAALLHLIAGVCLGLYFKVLILIPAVLLSIMAIAGIAHEFGQGLMLPLIVSEAALQIGYVAGSMAAVLFGFLPPADDDGADTSHTLDMTAAERIFENQF